MRPHSLLPEIFTSWTECDREREQYEQDFFSEGINFTLRQRWPRGKTNVFTLFINIYTLLQQTECCWIAHLFSVSFRKKSLLISYRNRVPNRNGVYAASHDGVVQNIVREKKKKHCSESCFPDEQWLGISLADRHVQTWLWRQQVDLLPV